MSQRNSILTLAVPPRFDLPMAVCRYGFYKLAPTRWNAADAALDHVFQFEEAAPLHAQITLRGGRLRVVCDRPTDDPEKSRLRAAVSRMLRLDEDFTAFHRIHAEARRIAFGRLFRSASLFEDIVRTMTCCNVTWPNTRRMNALLVERIGLGAFPTPGQIVAYGEHRLKADCKVGYRAHRIWRLARDVQEGAIDLRAFEDASLDSATLFDNLRSIHGIGPYTAANLLQLLGHYDRVAIDTESYALFEKVHGVKRPATPAGFRRLHRRIERHYAAHEPYQFLAYWFDLWQAYRGTNNDPLNPIPI